MKEIYNRLLKHFGKQGWWPSISKEKNKRVLEICIGAILTQNTNWSNVERAIDNLIKNNLISIEKIKEINEEKLSELIRSSGYYKQKARKIKELVGFLESGKEVNRENLVKVWGIGNETADSILCYAFDKPVFVVDSYTRRIFSRFGFGELDYDVIQSLVMKNLHNKYFNEFHALLVRLAKEYCKKEPVCNECPLNRNCKFS